MLPSVLTTQLRESLLDGLRTALSISDAELLAALAEREPEPAAAFLRVREQGAGIFEGVMRWWVERVASGPG